MSILTKTMDGALAIDSKKMSNRLGIWLIMVGMNEQRIINLFTETFYECNNDPKEIEKLLILILRLRDFRNGGHGRRLESRIALLTVLPLMNDIEASKIVKIKDIIKYNEEGLLSLEGMGDKGVKEIKKSIGEFGITLKQ